MKPNETTKNLIKCPHCGAEYLPEEIFVASELFGHPKVMKDKNGIIEYTDRDDSIVSEEYICDYCSKKFVSTIEFSFSSKLVDECEDDYEIKFDDVGIWR